MIESCGMRGGSGAIRLRCHRPVSGVRLPERRSRSAKWTWTSDAVKVTVHPESHSWPMERRECVLRAGTMCTRRAVIGKLGMSSSASWVEYIIVPFGFVIPIGDVVGRLFITWAVTVQKCAVLPLSAIARESGGIMVGGDLRTQ